MSGLEIAVILLASTSAILSLIAVVFVVSGRKKTVDEITENANKKFIEMERFQANQNDGLRENIRNDITGSQRDMVSHIDS